MQPDMPNPTQPPTTPGVYGPPPGQTITGGGKDRKKLPLIVGGGVTVVLLLVIVFVIVLRPEPKPQQEQEHEDMATIDPEGPQPAKALDVEQTNNSITQDITSLNDDEELPADQLNDENLDL